MFRFTIREMFWLVTVASLAIGWLIHSHSEQTEQQFLQIQMMDQRLSEAKDLIKQLQAVKDQEVSEKYAVDEKNRTEMTPLRELQLLPESSAEQRAASAGWHVRIVHRRLGSEL
jgi:hypothetical protein